MVVSGEWDVGGWMVSSWWIGGEWIVGGVYGGIFPPPPHYFVYMVCWHESCAYPPILQDLSVESNQMINYSHHPIKLSRD